MPGIQMNLVEIAIAEVSSNLADAVSTTRNGIVVTKGARIAASATLVLTASYVGQRTPDHDKEDWWSSLPSVHCQGELLGVCGEPWGYDCNPFMRMTYAKCTTNVEQTIVINLTTKITHECGTFALLDTYPLLAKREFALRHWRSPWPATFSPEIGDSVQISVKISTEMKLKKGSGNTFLYFSSRCDSPAFAIGVPNSYELIPAEE